jgi:hypothetical protein
MSDHPTKDSGAKSTRGFYTSKAKQNRIVERGLNGESARRIAREEHVDRDTVRRVLSDREAQLMIAQQQSRLLQLTPRAIDVYEDSMKSADPKIALQVATRILQGSGILDKRGLPGTLHEARNLNALRGIPVPSGLRPSSASKPDEDNESQHPSSPGNQETVDFMPTSAMLAEIDASINKKSGDS